MLQATNVILVILRNAKGNTVFFPSTAGNLENGNSSSCFRTALYNGKISEVWFYMVINYLVPVTKPVLLSESGQSHGLLRGLLIINKTVI